MAPIEKIGDMRVFLCFRNADLPQPSISKNLAHAVLNLVLVKKDRQPFKTVVITGHGVKIQIQWLEFSFSRLGKDLGQLTGSV